MLETLSALLDATLDPRRWDAVLDRIIVLTPAVGAGYIIRHKVSGRVEWAARSGIVAAATPAPDDAWLHGVLPLPRADDAAPWEARQQQVPLDGLQATPWYQELARTRGISGALGLLLHQDSLRTALLVLFAAHPTSTAQLCDAVPRRLLEPLSKAAQLHLAATDTDLRHRITAAAMDALATAVLVVDRALHVVETNRRAAALMQAAEPLLLRDGQLRTARSFETRNLTKLVAATVDVGPGCPGRMLLARTDGTAPYVATVLPLAIDAAGTLRGLALLVLVDPKRHVPSAADLTACFGLSPAEARLAVDLMTGRRLSDIARQHQVHITTLRSQLRSALRKTGTERQADLIRVLSSIGIAGGGDPAAQ